MAAIPPLRAAALTLALGISFLPISASDAVSGCPATSTLATSAAVIAAASCARDGATLTLASGKSFEAIDLRVLRPRNLTITSSNPQQPAILQGLTVYDSSGLTLRHLDFRGTPPPKWRYVVHINGGAGFKAEYLRLVGDASPATLAMDSAMMVRDLTGATIRRLQITGHRNGLTVLNLERAQIVENSIYRMQTDGIRGGGINASTIARNVIGGFHPAAGDHPDAIQLWSRNQTKSAVDITIEGNVVVRGAGAPIQGIFIEDRINLPYRGLVVRNNLVVGGMYNGIMLYGVDGAQVIDNLVVPLEPQMSWIRVQDGRNVELLRNQAGNFLLNEGLSSTANRRIGVKRDASAEIAEWRNKFKLPAADFPI